jgi:hypothetical protein
MATDIARSNSLTDLAHRINIEHEAVTHALQRGLAHAITAGGLLMEAKELVPHGRWLPWLREHCPQVSERTAQRYMEVARHAPAKNDTLSDLTLELPPLSAEPPPDWSLDGDFGRWVQRRLGAPFDAADMFDGDGIRFDRISTKLRHQVEMPWIVEWCFSVSEYAEGHPPLRLASWDDLLKAAEALAPLVNGKRTLKFDGFANMQSMRWAISIVEIKTMWMLGNILNEMDDREDLSDERYEQDWKETHSRVMGALEAAIAARGGTVAELSQTVAQ